MNVRVTVPDAIDQSLLPAFLRTQETPRLDASKLVGLALAVVLNVAAVVAIVWGGLHVVQQVAPPPLMVSLNELKPAKQVEPPKPPPLARPDPVTVTPPEISIASDAPPPIQTVVAPTPVKAAPPPPVAGTGETQQSYLARLLSYLNRYKRYPADAKAAHVQGVVMLHFVMDKAGRVTTFEINQSSGKPSLDAEALALIQRAQPLPAIPADFGKDTINAIVPIEFTLR